MTQPISNPTYVWTFLVAAPGSWQPVVVKSDQPAPSTTAELEDLLGKVAAGLGTTRDLIRQLGEPICLWAEPFVDPNKEAASKLIVPNGKIIVPGRD